MINIKTSNNCCGCTACSSACSRHAIVMKPDALGFPYPVVDKSKCVDCGLCEKVCAFNDNYDVSSNLPMPIAYGARHKRIDEVKHSRSGAVFVAISDYVLEKGGVVYGAGYADHFRVVHKRSVTKDERDEFRGSKYVQSDINTVFSQVKKDLKDGLTVLFSGTPCQTSGLNSYVGEKLRKNLLLIDIICHGVPSPKIWQDYIKYLERKKKDVICEVNFRDKEKFGWKAHFESFKFLRGEVITNRLFTNVFYEHIMFRHSCANCHFCNLRRPSDITIGDFWGIENVDKEFNADNYGVNIMLVNTQKGAELFETIKKHLNVILVNVEDCLQPNLQHPSVPHPKRQEFESFYSKNGFERTMYQYGFMGWRYKVKWLKKTIGIRVDRLKNAIGLN